MKKKILPSLPLPSWWRSQPNRSEGRGAKGCSWKSEYDRLCCVSRQHTSHPRRNGCCFWGSVKRLQISHLFPHRGGRNRALHSAIFGCLHLLTGGSYENTPNAEEWIQFQSSMADYSWQGLTSSCQHWSHNRCFVSSTQQSLKDKTVFSFAHRELLSAATPSFLITGVSSNPASGSRLTPERCVFGGLSADTSDRKVLIWNLTFYLCCCTSVDEEIKAPGGCGLEHHSQGADGRCLELLSDGCWNVY